MRKLDPVTEVVILVALALFLAAIASCRTERKRRPFTDDEKEITVAEKAAIEIRLENESKTD